MLGDDALVALLDGFLDDTIDLPTFEHEFLDVYKQSPIENPAMQETLGRAFSLSRPTIRLSPRRQRPPTTSPTRR